MQRSHRESARRPQRFTLTPIDVRGASASAARRGLICLATLVFVGVSLVMADPVPVEGVLPPADAQADQQQYPEVTAALEKFKTNDFNGALEDFNAASEKHAELPPGEVLMAQVFFRAAQQPTANQAAFVQAGRSYLERAVVAHPDDPDAYLYFGDLSFAQQHITAASVLFEKAFELTQATPDDSPRKTDLRKRSNAGLSAVAESRQDWEKALQHLDTWLELDPDNAGAHLRKGRALFAAKKPAGEAYKEFQAAAAINQDVVPPEITMGRLYDQQGNDAKAADWMQYALKKSPDSVQTLLGVARWHWDHDQVSEAKTHADAAAKIDAQSLDAKLMQALIARYNHDFPAAERLFDEVYIQTPNNFGASNMLAVTLADQNDRSKHTRALGLAEENMKQQPGNAAAATTLAWVYYKLNRAQDAENTLVAVASRGNMTSDAAFYLATIWAAGPRAEQAKSLLTQALEQQGPFVYRQQAEQLLADLNARPAASP